MKTMAMPSRALQLGEELEDLRLHRHVERGRRLVGDQHVRVAGERHGDHHPLALAAGELVRVGVDAALGLGDADERQELDDPRPRLRLREAAVEAQRLGELGADPVERVERGHRLLEDHGDLLAADAVELAFRQAEHLLAAVARPSRWRGR